MIKDTVESILSNITERFKNPLLGMIPVVWAFYNWKFIISICLINYSEGYRQHFISNIEKFIEEYNIHFNIFWVIAIAFLIIIFTYFLLLISRYIVNIYSKKLLPLIYKWSDSDGLVLKAERDKLRSDLYILENKIEDERAKKLNLQNINESLEKSHKTFLEKEKQKHDLEIKELEKSVHKYKSESEKYYHDKAIVTTEFQDLKSKHLKDIKILTSEKNEIETELDNLKSKLKMDDLQIVENRDKKMLSDFEMLKENYLFHAILPFFFDYSEKSPFTFTQKENKYFLDFHWDNSEIRHLDTFIKDGLFESKNNLMFLSKYGHLFLRYLEK